MAKKNKKNKGQVAARPLSAKEYIRTKARQLELGTCYMSNNREVRDAQKFVIVTRRHKQGNITLAAFIIDTDGLGVLDSMHEFNLPQEDFQEYLKLQEENNVWKFEQVSYELAHNYIYGAVAWAEEAGFQPASSFELDRYILEEDTDDVPLIELEFGKDGKHIIHCFSESECERRYNVIIQHLKQEEFEIIFHMDKDEDDDDEDFEDDGDDEGDFPEELTHPRFVQMLKHADDQEIMDYAQRLIEDSKDNPMLKLMLEPVIKRGADAVRKAVIMMSEMAERTKKEQELYPELPYQVVDDTEYPCEAKLSKTFQNVFLTDCPWVWNLKDLPPTASAGIRRMKKENQQAQLLSLLTAAIGDYKKNPEEQLHYANLYCAWQLMLECVDEHCVEDTRKVLLQWLRQPKEFLDFHFGCYVFDILPELCAPLFKDAQQQLLDFIKDSQYTPFKKAATDAFTSMLKKGFISREQCVEAYRDIYRFWAEHWDEHRYCCAEDISLALCHAMELHLSELKPEVERFFTLDHAVNPNICGSKEDVMKEVMG